MKLFKFSCLFLLFITSGNLYAESKCFKENRDNRQALYLQNSVKKNIERLEAKKEKLLVANARRSLIIDANITGLIAKLNLLKGLPIENCTSRECDPEAKAKNLLSIEKRISAAQKRKLALNKNVEKVDLQISKLQSKLPDIDKTVKEADEKLKSCSGSGNTEAGTGDDNPTNS